MNIFPTNKTIEPTTSMTMLFCLILFADLNRSMRFMYAPIIYKQSNHTKESPCLNVNKSTIVNDCNKPNTTIIRIESLRCSF